MENENISPEERLFNVIKDGRQGVPSDDKNVAGKKEERNQVPDSLPGVKPSADIKNFFQRVKDVLEGILQSNDPSGKGLGWLKGKISIQVDTLLFNPRDIDIRIVNKILGTVLALLLIFIAYFSYHNRRSIKDVAKEVSDINYQRSVDMVEPFKTAAFYLDEINKRNIFNIYTKEVKEAAVDTTDKGIKERLKTLGKDLKVIGISWGDDPRVMIKSKEKNKVYFLKEGQNIGATNATVTGIKKNNVKIGLEGEETELK